MLLEEAKCMNPAEDFTLITVKIKMAFAQGKWNHWCSSYGKHWKAFVGQGFGIVWNIFNICLCFMICSNYFDINDIMIYRA